jgi:hypothetical protein
MSVELVGEDAQRACDECDCSVGMAARAAVRNLRETSPQQPGVGCVPAALHELLEARCDRGETVDTRAALSGALLRQVASHARGLDDAAGVGGKDDDRARAE